jgi:predicted kinase
MPRLLLTRGLPASGKTTFAKAWVAEDPEHRVRVNRDDLRGMIFSKPSGLSREQENAITTAQQSVVVSALRKGLDVVVDDTNLNAHFAKQWLKVAAENRAEVEWHDEFLDVSVWTCIERDQRRQTGQVGHGVIQSFYDRYLKVGKPKRPTLDEGPDLSIFKPYSGTPGKPEAFLVDLDGTIAHGGHRGFFDWEKVGEDEPVEHVIRIVQALERDGLTPIFVSGRDAVCRYETAQWIIKHVYSGTLEWIMQFVYGTPVQSFGSPPLFMRPEGDGRKDSIVKLEIFDRYIRDNYDVKFALDDRNQVVRAYRDILGLPVLQCRDGDF